MKLPNAKNAIIFKEKLSGYILSDTHPIGKFKARVFRKIGFNHTNINILKKELRNIVNSQEIKSETASSYGTKYIIDGQIHSPNGKIINVRTIWIIETGQDEPRFVTVYPL